MFDTARRPSAEELEELSDLCRRNPGSPAFVELGEMYLALGRPRDAIEVGARGLKADPNSIDGRMMVSRAFVMLHQWKQAQAELLKVVRADRTHGDGFSLLGEVLMRRADYERALPVLQHAQNLDPANPAVLALLKRARNGQPLDPPPPIPTPIQPQSRRMSGGPTVPSAPPLGGPGFADDAPTNVAHQVLPGGLAAPGAPTAMLGVGPNAPSVPGAGFDQRRDEIRDRLPLSKAPTMSPRMSPLANQPMPTAANPVSLPSSPSGAAGPPPPVPTPGTPGGARTEGGPAVRPRVLPAHKPKDAAQSALRQSAAVGENYLNNLLTNGLLDIPNVRAPESEFDLSPSKRWGRSTRRAFIFLFVVMFLGVGGGGYYYYYTEQQKAAAVAKYLGEARELMVLATYDDLEAAIDRASKALKADPGNLRAMATYARAGALGVYLYGTTSDRARAALARVRDDIKPGDGGYRDVIVAGAAMTLADLSRLEQPVAQLADTRTELDAWLEKHEDDAEVRWLQGLAMLAVGDRNGALTAFKVAEADGQGPVVATIARSDMLLDNGDYEGAMAGYKAALDRAPKHPLALLGRSLGRAERSTESADTMEELNVGLAKDQGPRVEAYKTLASAYALYVLGDYAGFAEKLDEAGGVSEPRYLVRLALGRILQGDIQKAGEIRGRIIWYGKDKPKATHPLLLLVDAEILHAQGLPEAALERLGDAAGARAQLLRGRALYAMGKYDQALKALDELFEVAPEDLEGQLWREAARLVANKKERSAAREALDSLSRKAKTKLARYIYGDALHQIGRNEDARSELERSLEEITPEYPNPAAYRAHVVLAEMDVAAGKIKDALPHLEAALELNQGYLPLHALLGRILVLSGDRDGALSSLRKVVQEPEATDAVTWLAFAEALALGKPTEEDRKLAADALRKAKEAKIPTEELIRVIGLVDPALAEEFGVELPKEK